MTGFEWLLTNHDFSVDSRGQRSRQQQISKGETMKVCENCGLVDSPKWRGGRFDFNSEYCDFADAPEGLGWVQECLKDARNFEPLVDGLVTYYRRGKLGKYLYRVATWDFRVERERVRHDVDVNQRVLFSGGFPQKKSTEAQTP